MATRLNNFKLGKRSLGNLAGVQPLLVAVTVLALTKSTIDFAVTDGLRTPDEQAKLLLEGKSRTMNSRHLTGHAVDLAAFVNGKISWDWHWYEKLADAMKLAAEELGVAIEWGGDWTTFRDGPHFQLSRKDYP